MTSQIATWGAAASTGTVIARKDRFIHYSTNTFTKFIDSVLQDKSGKLWIGTNGGGVDVLDPITGGTHTYAHDPSDPNSLSDNDVKTITEDYRHRIWLGTAGGEVNIFGRTKGFKSYQHNPAITTTLANDIIQKISEDQHHQLWIATQGGIIIGSSACSLITPQPLQQRAHVPRQRRRAIWVGTDNGGLNILNTKTGAFQNLSKG